MSNVNRSGSPATKLHNRVLAICQHTTRYAFRGTPRLAADAKIARSTLWDLMNGKTCPRYSTVHRIVKCLETHVGRTLDICEVFSVDGSYAKSVCELMNCPGCLPDAIYENDGSRKPHLSRVQSGRWTGDIAEFDGGSSN